MQDARVRQSSTIEGLYRTQGPVMWRSLLAFTASPEVADDALSEAFAQAIARGEELHDAAAWIWRAAFRIAAGELKERRTRFSELGDPEVGYFFPEPLLHVFEALSHLSPNQRAAIVLHDYADRPVAEVAATLGASRATVYVHLSKGRRRLRSLLEDDDA
ncbi:MAG: sigma-70 family RNA polymerase sigma factor [Actinomycetota bacterium]|nr:sigma-70 family RNA polymerase sigma factor [Actinomycetota bacterium]